MRSTALLLLCVGCHGGDDDSGPTTCVTANEGCGPDTPCDGEEGPLMLPGADCGSCHVAGGEAEPYVWTVAGTAFADELGSEPLAGATVHVTDAEGVTVDLPTNQAGNFWTATPLTFPYQASLESDDGTADMYERPMDGACNSCHKCDGPAGGKLSPGR